MSWDQNYSVPSVESLLEKLTGRTALELLEHEAYMKGFRVVQTEEILLDGGMYEDVKGKIVHLGDGRVFVPKLVKKETANGNWGCDYYEYVLEGEIPKVEQVYHEEIETINCSDDCGC